VLWDLESNKGVGQIYDGDITNTPEWTLDGEFLLTAAPPRSTHGYQVLINSDDGLDYKGGSELFVMSASGELRRLTYLTIDHKFIQKLYTWSPDGRFVSDYVYDPLSLSPLELIVVDVASKAVTSYCASVKIPPDYKGLRFWPSKPVWSPDGRYLVVTQIDSEFRYEVFLVELETGRAWKVAEDVSAMGWMTVP